MAGSHYCVKTYRIITVCETVPNRAVCMAIRIPGNRGVVGTDSGGRYIIGDKGIVPEITMVPVFPASAGTQEILKSDRGKSRWQPRPKNYFSFISVS